MLLFSLTIKLTFIISTWSVLFQMTPAYLPNCVFLFHHHFNFVFLQLYLSFYIILILYSELISYFIYLFVFTWNSLPFQLLEYNYIIIYFEVNISNFFWVFIREPLVWNCKFYDERYCLEFFVAGVLEMGTFHLYIAPRE